MTNIEKLLIDNGFIATLVKNPRGEGTRGDYFTMRYKRDGCIFVDVYVSERAWYAWLPQLTIWSDYHSSFTYEELVENEKKDSEVNTIFYSIAKAITALEDPWGEAKEEKK